MSVNIQGKQMEDETVMMPVYKNGREYLLDELLKLNMLISLRLIQFRNDYRTKHNDHAGLCITDGEINDAVGAISSNQERDQSETTQKRYIRWDEIDDLRYKISVSVEQSIKERTFLPFFQLSDLLY